MSDYAELIARVEARSTRWMDEAALLAALKAVMAERDEARRALERDRSKVADTIEAVRTEITGREWLLTGRGPYEWDDDRYRDEFAQALAAIRGPIDSLRAIARDWTNCPTDPAEIQAARTSDAAALHAKVSEVEGALLRLRANHGHWNALQIEQFVNAALRAIRAEPQA